MAPHDPIERFVRDTLDLLEKPDALHPDPSFVARVLRRVEAPAPRRAGVDALLRPSLLVLLLLANIAAAWNYLESGVRSQHAAAQREMIDILAGERIAEADHATPSVTE